MARMSIRNISSTFGRSNSTAVTGLSSRAAQSATSSGGVLATARIAARSFAVAAVDQHPQLFAAIAATVRSSAAAASLPILRAALFARQASISSARLLPNFVANLSVDSAMMVSASIVGGFVTAISGAVTAASSANAPALTMVAWLGARSIARTLGQTVPAGFVSLFGVTAFSAQVVTSIAGFTDLVGAAYTSSSAALPLIRTAVMSAVSRAALSVASQNPSVSVKIAAQALARAVAQAATTARTGLSSTAFAAAMLPSQPPRWIAFIRGLSFLALQSKSDVAGSASLSATADARASGAIEPAGRAGITAAALSIISTTGAAAYAAGLQVKATSSATASAIAVGLSTLNARMAMTASAGSSLGVAVVLGARAAVQGSHRTLASGRAAINVAVQAIGVARADFKRVMQLQAFFRAAAKASAVPSGSTKLETASLFIANTSARIGASAQLLFMGAATMMRLVMHARTFLPSPRRIISGQSDRIVTASPKDRTAQAQSKRPPGG
jgi:hypothetical protein